MKKFNWGIIGPGKIAAKFARALQNLEDANLYAVASRSAERARAFAEQFAFAKAYGSYAEMLNDPALDIVYIATPHPFHFEQTMMCLEKGIPVLCEKPITMNEQQMQILAEAAGKNNVFLMQGLWTRFLPTIDRTLQTIVAGKIGRIRVIEADFGFKAEYNPASRLFNPSLGGGSLLDIGIYPVFLSLLLLGYPQTINACATKAITGVDESMAISFGYNYGAIASLHCTFAAHTGTQATIFCDNGSIHIYKRWFAPSSMQIEYDGSAPEEIKFDYGVNNGYEGEAAEAMRCLREGLTESPMISTEFSLKLMKLLDEIRNKCDIKYPEYEQNSYR